MSDFGGDEPYDLGDEFNDHQADDDDDDEPSTHPVHAAGPPMTVADDRGVLKFVVDPPEVDVAAMFPQSNATAVPRMVNSLSMLRIERAIDLRRLTCAARNAEFIPARHATILRIREPQCAALVRTSGAVTISGASSVAAAKRAAIIFSRIIRVAMGWGSDLKEVKFSMKSMMYRFDLRHPVRLEDLASARRDVASYEPDAFCGCTVRLKGITEGREWYAACNVFVSGKVTVTGLRSDVALRHAYNGLLPIIAPFAQGAVPLAPADGAAP